MAESKSTSCCCVGSCICCRHFIEGLFGGEHKSTARCCVGCGGCALVFIVLILVLTSPLWGVLLLAIILIAVILLIATFCCCCCCCGIMLDESVWEKLGEIYLKYCCCCCMTDEEYV